MKHANAMCSFCGKTHAEVQKLISGPGVYICDGCVSICAGVLAKELDLEVPTPQAQDPSLRKLQKWYREECKNQRKRPIGVEITAHGSDGWLIRIDLSETVMDGVRFEPVNQKRSDQVWFTCRIENGQFVGEGSASSLEQIIYTFSDWLETRKRDIKNAAKGIV